METHRFVAYGTKITFTQKNQSPWSYYMRNKRGGGVVEKAVKRSAAF